MICPACGTGKMLVVDVRPETGHIRRRYKCRIAQCGYRYTTYEVGADRMEMIKRMPVIAGKLRELAEELEVE